MSPAKLFVGMDWSMSCPAITTFLDVQDFTFPAVHCYYISEKVPKALISNIAGLRLPSYSCNEERFELLANWGIDVIETAMSNAIDRGYRPEPEVFIEDYSFGATGKVFHIAECAGQIKHRVWKAGFPLHTVPPTVIKKWATGKGNADKQGMHKAFVERTTVDLQSIFSPKAGKVGSPVGDIVDSFFICGYGNSTGR